MIIFDSNIWIALFNENDPLNSLAGELVDKHQKVYVPYAVALEVISVLTYKASKKVADHFIETLVNNQDIVLIENEYIPEMFYFMNFSQRLALVDYSLLYLKNQHGYQLETFDKQLAQMAKKQFDKGKVESA